MSNSKKNKKEYSKVEEQEWIQMEDLKIKKNQNLARKFAKQQNKNFVEYNESMRQNHYLQQNKNKEAYKNINTNNFDQSNRNLAREEFNKQEVKSAKKPSIPLMQVLCDFCTLMQNVPGNTQLFICGSCQNMNQCQPLYGVFVCGCCQSKVFYGFGINQYVKCPKCKTINRVPLEPLKKYISNQKPNKKQIAEQKANNRQQVQQQELIIQNPQRNLTNMKQIKEESQFQYPGI